MSDRFEIKNFYYWFNNTKNGDHRENEWFVFHESKHITFKKLLNHFERHEIAGIIVCQKQFTLRFLTLPNFQGTTYQDFLYQKCGNLTQRNAKLMAHELLLTNQK